MEREITFHKHCVRETIDISIENLLDNKKYFHNIPKDALRELSILTINESYILFNNGYCHRFVGVVMYSPLGPAFANIFLVYTKLFVAEKHFFGIKT